MTAWVPLKRIARLKYGDALGVDQRIDGPYPVIGSGGVSGTHNRRNFEAPGIVVGRKGSYGSVHWAPRGGFAIDTAYYIDRTCTSADLRWLLYALQAVNLRGVSQDVGVPGLSRESAYEVNLPRIPLDEQRRIADFLDAETERIDKLQEVRLNQSDLILNLQQSRLNSLFSNLRSGYDSRLKYLFAVRPRYGVLVPQFVDDGVPFIRVNDLQYLETKAHDLRMIPQDLSTQYARTIVRPGDLLVSVVGTLGRAAIAPASLAGANIARAVCSIRVLPQVEVELVEAWLSTSFFQDQALTATSTDTAQPTLGMEDLGNFQITWPADQSERRQLMREIASLRSSVFTLKTRMARQHTVLAERRQALITAAVTGQIDVSTASGRGIED